MPKVISKAFRFSNTTADNLKELVELGIVRNETEAIDLAIMHFLTEKKTELQYKNFMGEKQENVQDVESRRPSAITNRTKEASGGVWDQMGFQPDTGDVLA